MSYVKFQNITITEGFWKKQQNKNQSVTLNAVYDRFKESGRFDATACTWQEGDDKKPHIFWDSDIAKWIEGAAYILENECKTEIERIIDDVVENIAQNQLENGYFNSYFLTIEPNAIFTRRMDHELYCAGHYLEAAIAYYQATGKSKLLVIMENYIDYIDKRFRINQDTKFDTPGHQEIELALYRLYMLSQKEEHLELLRFFINTRGNSEKDKYHGIPMNYTQSHEPVRDQSEVVGHCVRALYMYCAMADLAAYDHDDELLNACERLYSDITEKKLYITGGVGSTYVGEAFTYPYDLPDYMAYTETCASIALAMFCRKMWNINPEAKYTDLAERAIYNTVLAGISLTGDKFFYENPLACNPLKNELNNSRSKEFQEHIPIIERVRLFDCSCCPPNLLRFIASIGDYMYSCHDDTIYTHMYMAGNANIPYREGVVNIKQKTDYPYGNVVQLTMNSCGQVRLAIRIPEWADGYQIQVEDKLVNGKSVKGYVFIDRMWSYGDKVDITFGRKVHIIEANPAVTDLCGRGAVTYGPLVYCAEGIDNVGVPIRDIRIKHNQSFRTLEKEIENNKVMSLVTTAKVRKKSEALYADSFELEEFPFTMIPYYAWANRGISEMSVWMLLQ